MSFTVREACLDDVQNIREVFQSEYAEDYAYPQYYDTEVLARLVYAEDSILLVAEDSETRRLAGTASVVFSVGAHDDLTGEFGRLVVHPDFRGCGIGKSLMQARINRVRERLHVGIVDNRAVHSFSQRISERFGFVPVGFIPMKLLVHTRESVAVYAQHFGQALELRRNNPHIIPEAAALAALALENCQLPQDLVIDDSSLSYPCASCDWNIEELQTRGYTSLLRIERGRLRHRDIFGPVRLHYGLFQIHARHSHYLIAKRGDQIAGGVGYMIDQNEKALRIFEMIAVDEQPIRPLLQALLNRCQHELGMEYVDVDVSAHSPRMQRTLLELGFLPVSYVPANVFDAVERLDAIRMARLFVPLQMGTIDVTARVRPIANVVLSAFEKAQILPRLSKVYETAPLCAGLAAEQQQLLSSILKTRHYAAGQPILTAGSHDSCTHLILDGRVELRDASGPIAELRVGQCLGESNLLDAEKSSPPHSLDAVALCDTTTASVSNAEFQALIRRRPDLGLVVYRNLARDVSSKLRQWTEKSRHQ